MIIADTDRTHEFNLATRTYLIIELLSDLLVRYKGLEINGGHDLYSVKYEMYNNSITTNPTTIMSLLDLYLCCTGCPASQSYET